jgi:ABC-type transport system involved in multi-copper enzyme maturation permease subunit
MKQLKYHSFIFYDDKVRIIEYKNPIGEYICDLKHMNILKQDNIYAWFQPALMFNYLPIEYVEKSMTINSMMTTWLCVVKKIVYNP